MLYNPLSKLTKIGTTTNLSRRKKELENQCGTQLELIYLDYKKEYLAVEKQLHLYYNKYREQGEFFNLPTEIVNYIRRYK